jgi:hypothetical protein
VWIIPLGLDQSERRDGELDGERESVYWETRGRLQGSESGKLGHAVHEILAVWDGETRLIEKLEEGVEMITCQEV